LRNDEFKHLDAEDIVDLRTYEELIKFIIQGIMPDAIVEVGKNYYNVSFSPAYSKSVRIDKIPGKADNIDNNFSQMPKTNCSDEQTDPITIDNTKKEIRGGRPRGNQKIC